MIRGQSGTLVIWTHYSSYNRLLCYISMFLCLPDILFSSPLLLCLCFDYSFFLLVIWVHTYYRITTWLGRWARIGYYSQTTFHSGLRPYSSYSSTLQMDPYSLKSVTTYTSGLETWIEWSDWFKPPSYNAEVSPNYSLSISTPSLRLRSVRMRKLRLGHARSTRD